MAYTDLTASFAYKTLLTYQLMTNLANNDKLFNDQLTAAMAIPQSLLIANTFGISAKESGGTARNLIKFDGSNVIQLGAAAAADVRVPADPTDVLGVATKQYVDGQQVLQLQALVSGSSGINGSFATILNYTGKGECHAIYVAGGTNNGAAEIKITVDGTLVLDITSISITSGNFLGLQANLTWQGTLQANASLVSFLLRIPFKTSLKIEVACANSAAQTVNVAYSHT